MVKLVSLVRKVTLLVSGDAMGRRAFLLRAVQVAAGPVNSLLLVLCMSAEEQGIYYLFMGLLAVRILFELGASTAIGQLAAHAISADDWGKANPFICAVNRWMLRAAGAMAVLTAAGGAVFLVVQSHGDFPTIAAWLLLVLGFAGGLCLEGRLSVLYGSGRLPTFFRIRLISSVVLVVGNWLLLLAGVGLFSFGWALLASLIVTELLCWREDPALFQYKIGFEPFVEEEHMISIKRLLSRVSCISLPVFLCVNYQALICLHLLGAPQLALLGFVSAIGTSAIGISSVWMHAALPALTAHAARKELDKARKFYRGRLILTLAWIAAGVTVSIGAVMILKHWPKFSERLPEWPVVLLVFASGALQNLMSALVVWPRAFLLEPFSRVGLGQMILMPLLMYWGAQQYGLPGLAAASLVTWGLGVFGVYLKWPHITEKPGFA